MGQPTPEMMELLKQAAHLRALGIAWRAIAEELKIPQAECESWPELHGQLWRSLQRQAEQRVRRECDNESRAILRLQMRSEDEKIKLAAAKALYPKRPAPKRSSKPQFPVIEDPELAALIAVWKVLKDEQRRQLAGGGSPDRWPRALGSGRAGAGRPE